MPQMLRFRKHISLFLFLVLSVLLLPREVIHEFYGHTDTPYDYCKDHEGIHVEPQHVHCAIFDFNLPAFFYSFSGFGFYIPSGTILKEAILHSHPSAALYNLSFSRAPPSPRFFNPSSLV